MCPDTSVTHVPGLDQHLRAAPLDAPPVTTTFAGMRGRSLAGLFAALGVAGFVLWTDWSGEAPSIPDAAPTVPHDGATGDVRGAPSPAASRDPGALHDVAAAGRTASPPIPEQIVAAALCPTDKQAFDYLNQVLAHAGKDVIPDRATILAEDLPRVVDAIRNTKARTEQLFMDWRVAVLDRSRREVKQLEADLARGVPPRHDRLPAGSALPRVSDRDERISVHMPAGSSDQYVIRLPGSLFPDEIGAYRRAEQGQLALFDQALRSLFSVPPVTRNSPK